MLAHDDDDDDYKKKDIPSISKSGRDSFATTKLDVLDDVRMNFFMYTHDSPTTTTIIIIMMKLKFAQTFAVELTLKYPSPQASYHNYKIHVSAEPNSNQNYQHFFYKSPPHTC